MVENENLNPQADNLPLETGVSPEAPSASVSASPSFWGAMAAAILGGLLFSVPFQWTQLAWLQWVSVLPLLWAMRKQSADRAFWLGWVFGFSATMLGYDHLIFTIVRFGGFHWAYGGLIVTLFSALTAFSFALFGWLTRRITPNGNPLIVAAIWTGIELIYPNLFPRTLGHTQFAFLPFIQIADLGGMAILSFVMVWTQAAGFSLWEDLNDSTSNESHRRWSLLHFVGTLAVIGLSLGYGYWRIGEIKTLAGQAPAMMVGTVQPNFAPDRIMGAFNQPGAQLVNDKVQQMLTNQLRDVDLVVWPESSRLIWYPDHWVDLNPEALKDKAGNRLCPALDYRPYPALNKPILFGALGFIPDPKNERLQLKRFNRNVLVSADGRVIGKFDKHILMPFGETLPLGSVFPFLRKLTSATSLLDPGESLDPMRMDNGTLLGTMSCYEDMIAPVPRTMVRNGAELLIVLLNDNWFGESAATYQHLMLSVFRTVELRRYLVRGTNTGVSAMVAPWGEIVAQAPAFIPTVNKGQVRLLKVMSPYAQVGDLFGWVCVGATGVLLIGSFFRPQAVK